MAKNRTKVKIDELPTFIKAYRHVNDLTLRDLAYHTETCNASTISRLENGDGNPTLNTLRDIADVLEVEIIIGPYEQETVEPEDRRADQGERSGED